MRRSIKEIYRKAYGKFGVGAFNVFTAEQVHGLFAGAAAARLPVIVQITPVGRNYMHPLMLEKMIEAAQEIYPTVDYCVHLDHGNPVHCLDAIESDFYDSIMIDASHLPYEENVKITSEIVRLAHKKGIAVEAELGMLSGLEENKDVSEQDAFYTSPKEAADFVKRTKCDSLAVAVGTSHGAYKFSSGQGLRLDILNRIVENLPKNFPLVLHGASAVPQDEIQRINSVGGQIKSEAKGVSLVDLRAAIELGVCKINIATDLRLIWARVTREFFMESPEKFDPILAGATYIKEVSAFVKNKCVSLSDLK